jgi:hypothetical protein
MSDEPTYPEEAAVGAEAAKQSAAGAAAEENAAESSTGKRKQYVRAGVAVGIGSAAIVAALLYANRGKRGGDKGNG